MIAEVKDGRIYIDKAGSVEPVELSLVKDQPTIRMHIRENMRLAMNALELLLSADAEVKECALLVFMDGGC